MRPRFDRYHRERRIQTTTILLLFAGLSAGCVPSQPREIVVYAALDKEFSAPILEAYAEQSSVAVRPKYDVESNKTVGLANEIIAQRSRPRVDLFWNNEILHTIRLEKLGLLHAYRSSQADNFPSEFVSSKNLWHGFAARARVLLVNQKLLGPNDPQPASILDLADPRWRGRCGLARPFFGTTATHAAVLFSAWPADQAKTFFQAVRENAVLESGNKQVARNVAAGRYAFGLTDTDDAIIECESQAGLMIVFPDQGPDQLGTLLIPNTLAIVAGGPNTAAAEQLVNHLLGPEVERALAAAASAQIPLNRQVRARSRAAPDQFRRMPVDFERAAETWEKAQTILQEIFR